MLRKLIPPALKPLCRFVYYKQERAKVFREPGIRRLQDERIRQYDPAARKLVVFIILGADYDTGVETMSGGIMSIVSLCAESRQLKNIHGAEVLLCTLPGQHLLARHTRFRSTTDIFRYEQLSQYFQQVEDVLIHVPEFLCASYLELSSRGDLAWLNSRQTRRLNILNQNIRHMPAPEVVAEMKRLASVTVTTAHQRYCTAEFRDRYQVSVHKFSVWLSPEQYERRAFAEKENLLLVSPDGHADKNAVVGALSSVPGLRIQVIQGISYEEFKQACSRAKWSLTFGEGLDGYLIEPVFGGAIGFAVYNNEFFTTDFAALRTIYPSMAALKERIVADMAVLDREEKYREYQETQFAICAKYYNADIYRRNIVAFYRGDYTFSFPAGSRPETALLA